MSINLIYIKKYIHLQNTSLIYKYDNKITLIVIKKITIVSYLELLSY